MIPVEGVEYHGYRDCLRLANGRAEVIAGAACGGRVLRYACDGQDALALLPEQAGWTWRPGAAEIDPWGGRFDVGPERTIAPHPTLWLGPWSAEPAAGAVLLRSAPDPATGLQLVRELRLDPTSTHLSCRQTVTNVSNEVRSFCHWGRTMTPGGGIAVVPENPGSRLPHGYVQYDGTRPGLWVDFAPRDPNVRRRDGFLEIVGPVEQAKMCFDTAAGWMAYLEPSGLLFVKRFPVYPERASAELGPFTLSIWLYQDRYCELEPIGPAERLAPGASASFTEDWWLLRRRFPARRDALDLGAVAEQVEREAR